MNLFPNCLILRYESQNPEGFGRFSSGDNRVFETMENFCLDFKDWKNFTSNVAVRRIFSIFGTFESQLDSLMQK